MRGQTVIGILGAALLTLTTAGAVTAAIQEDSEDGPPALTTLNGTLTKDGEEYAVGGTEVGFGPVWYITAVDASADYDGDDTVETIGAELDGLVGTTVTLVGEAGRCGDVDAFTINDRPYRATTSGPPPWAGGSKKVGALHPVPEVLTTQAITTTGRAVRHGLASVVRRGPGPDRVGPAARAAAHPAPVSPDSSRNDMSRRNTGHENDSACCKSRERPGQGSSPTRWPLGFWC